MKLNKFLLFTLCLGIICFTNVNASDYNGDADKAHIEDLRIVIDDLRDEIDYLSKKLECSDSLCESQKYDIDEYKARIDFLHVAHMCRTEDITTYAPSANNKNNIGIIFSPRILCPPNKNEKIDFPELESRPKKLKTDEKDSCLSKGKRLRE